MTVLLYAHNFLEATHNAISDVLLALVKHGMNVRILAKHVYNNHLTLQFQEIAVYTMAETEPPSPVFENVQVAAVIFDGLPSARVCVLLRKLSIPYILIFHGGFDTNVILYNTTHAQTFMRTIHQASIVIVPTMQAQQAVNNLCPLAKDIRLFPPTFNVQYMRMVEDINKDKPSPFHVLMVGRLIPKKGIDVGIKALKLLPKKFLLDIIGSGPELRSLQSLAIQEGVASRVRWLGEHDLSYVLSSMNAGRILWHPSRIAPDGNVDGLSQVLLYAMASKMLVIATLAGASSAILLHRQNCIVIPADDPPALAQATLLLDDESRMRITEDAYHAVQSYRLDGQLAAWVEVFRHAMRNVQSNEISTAD